MYLLLISILSLLSTTLSQTAGCNQAISQDPGTTEEYYIDVGPNRRFFNVFLPFSYTSDTQTPLILSYHGNNKSSYQQQDLDRLTTPFFNTDHIVVYPQGIQRHWQPAPYAIPSASDLDFTAALLSSLQDSFCIDTKRIYATGKSVGGGFVGALACDPNLGPKFAAFAPVSAALYWDTFENTTECQPGRGTTKTAPILEFHGLNDTVIPYRGGQRHDADLPNIGNWTARWKVRNHCSMDQKPDVSLFFDEQVERVVYEGCDVEHWMIHGLGHKWPSTVKNDDNPCDSTYLNASSVIMDWFRQHNLPAQGKMEKEEL